MKNDSHYDNQPDLISVVIPVYNVAIYLPDCLNSVFKQTYRNTEIVIVDDGSTDGSGELCDIMSQNRQNVHVIHRGNGGLSAARNIGTAACHGAWIVYVDSDDVVAPNFISDLYDAAISTDADVAICPGLVFLDGESFVSTKTERTFVLESESAVTELLSERIASTAAWGKLARAKLWNNNPFPEGRKFEDLPVTWKVLRESGRIACVDGRYYGYRRRAQSISATADLTSVFDYRQSICQIYDELDTSSDRQYYAKTFRCCLECCRLLEMIYQVEVRNISASDRLAVNDVRSSSIDFLRRNWFASGRNSRASIMQRLRIVCMAALPRVVSMLRNELISRKS